MLTMTEAQLWNAAIDLAQCTEKDPGRIYATALKICNHLRWHACQRVSDVVLPLNPKDQVMLWDDEKKVLVPLDKHNSQQAQ